MRYILWLLAACALMALLVFGVMAAGAAFPRDELAFDAASTFVYVVDVRTGVQQRLIPDVAASRHPAWSPDGSQIAYEQIGADGEWHIYIANALGSNRHYLGDGANPLWSPAERWIAVEVANDIYIADLVSDGTKFAYSADLWPNYPYIYVLELSTGARITRLDGESPAWSPDGADLAYTATRVLTGERDIYIQNLNTGSRHWLTIGRAPVWSPDDRHIAYEYNQQVFIIAVTGGRPRRVSDGYGPVWSPDGAWLAFSRMNGSAADLILYRVDTGEEITLVSNGWTNWNPGWQPR